MSEVIQVSGARAVNIVDINIPAGQTKVAFIFEAAAGGRVSFDIVGDNTSDTFNGGYAGDARQYVRSNNGAILHAFTIEESGSYRLFFENTSNHAIHLTGTINIR